MKKTSKILIVDDTINTVKLLRIRLASEGYETAEAFDGEECLLKVNQCRPDLIILDVIMPKLNGYEVCRRLKAREDTKYIPVLMLTSKSEIEDKVKGLGVGADDYISKPFDYKELSARVRSLIAIREAGERRTEKEKMDALEQMMDGVAHEIRNPLVSIGGFARRVHDDLPEGDPKRKYLEMIIEDVQKLEKMIRRIIEIQTADILYIEPTNVNEVILSTLRRFDEELEEKAIDVETCLMDDPPTIQADKEQLGRAIGNLFQNSIEAMTGETRLLLISTHAFDGGIEVRVSDTGKGISRDKIVNIFEPLFTSKMYGPGLGLTQSLKIIQDHRGNISVESEPGKGTTITLRLPIWKY